MFSNIEIWSPLSHSIIVIVKWVMTVVLIFILINLVKIVINQTMLYSDQIVCINIRIKWSFSINISLHKSICHYKNLNQEWNWSIFQNRYSFIEMYIYIRCKCIPIWIFNYIQIKHSLSFQTNYFPVNFLYRNSSWHFKALKLHFHHRFSIHYVLCIFRLNSLDANGREKK